MRALLLPLLLLAAGCASNAAPPDPAPAPTGPPLQVVEKVVVRGAWVRAGDPVDGALWAVADGVRKWCAEQKEFELRHSVNGDGTTGCSCTGPVVAVPTLARTLTPESARARVAGGEFVMSGDFPADAISPQGSVQVIEVTCTLGGKCPGGSGR